MKTFISIKNVKARSHVNYSYLLAICLLLGGAEQAFANALPIENEEISIEIQSPQQKERLIKGTVTDASGEPIIGASVTVKGKSTGVITDLDGRYSISVSEGATIEIRYIGYNPIEVIVNKKKGDALDIRMIESSVSLDDVVVIGYGTQKKSSAVASMNSIGPAELNIKQRNLRNNIAGQIAGVIAVQRSGEPGNDAAAFYIRGQSSYAGGTSPLVLVDGIPRSMDDIDVDEIESFTVLKDASATAVYGAEGANGVVLITSKRGKVQKTVMNISMQTSLVHPTRMPESLDPAGHLSLYNEAKWNDAGNPNNNYFVPFASDELLNKYISGTDRDLYPSTNWNSLLKDYTQSQRYTINFRGGSEKTSFFISGAYYTENGIFNSTPAENYDSNIKLDRFNLRSNIDLSITKTTLLSIDMSGQYLMKRMPGFDSDAIFEQIMHFPTHRIPMFYSDRSASQLPFTEPEWINQPYNMINHSGYRKGWGAFLQTKVSLDQKLDFITKGLSVRGTISFDANFDTTVGRYKRAKTVFATGRNEDGSLAMKTMNEGEALGNPVKGYNSGSKKVYIEGSFNYKRTFAEKHDVTGMLLYMQKETQYQQEEGVFLLPYRKQSFVARANYSYDNRYSIEASMGMTGSENFASGQRWGIFPAIGAAWYLSNEDFMKDMQHVLRKMKLRASYGIAGNDNINGARFPYRGTINTQAGWYGFGLIPGTNGNADNFQGDGIAEGEFPVPTLTWEKERKFNIGLDLTLFQGQVDLVLDYFANRREDILIRRNTILNVSGFRTSPFQNFGITTNKGFDGSLVLKQRIGEVNLSARGNFTYAKNKIIECDEIPQKHSWLSQTGHSIGQPLLYIADGLYTPDDFEIKIDPVSGKQTYALKNNMAKPSALVAPGDIKYKDLNGDEVIDSYDKSYNNGLYSSLPEIVYGFGMNIEWKGFFAGVFFQGVANASVNMIANPMNIYPFVMDNDKSSTRKEAMNRWTAADPYNQNVFFPRMHPALFSHNQEPSTWWYRDAGFLRLKNVEIGYEFNKNTLKKIAIKNLRVFVQGTNLAIWDKIKYWDPEMGEAASGGKYPICGTYTAGLEVTF